MAIHELVHSAMKQHKQKIELFQLATMNGVASLLYSSFLAGIKQDHDVIDGVDTRKIYVPSISEVKNFLNRDSEAGKLFALEFIDRVSNDPLIQKYIDAPEFEILRPEYIETMKIIFELYIQENMHKYIPDVFRKKFGLDKDYHQGVYESADLSMFRPFPFTKNSFNFIAHETVLQLLMMIPSMKKITTHSSFNALNQRLFNNEILGIGNQMALCQIYFDISDEVIRNQDVMPMLSFVTNTQIIPTENMNEYNVITGVLNSCSVTELNGICTNET